VKRLQNDLTLKLDCGFLVSDDVPSEASYSRMMDDFKESNVLERAQERVILQAIEEGFIMDDTIAIDATHFEARDQAPSKTEQEKPKPKKRGRKSKAEREQWLKEKAEKEANLPLYQKKIEAQLDATLTELRREFPKDPQWGIKKNSDGKNVFWYGYKGHLAVSASSQYIIQSLFSSGNLNDGKAAIPLLKGINERLSLPTVNFHTMDDGYDYELIYKQIHHMNQQSVIAYNRRNEPIGFDKYFAPPCFREHSYRYDSYDDTKYETLKDIQPKECSDCPLVQEGI